MVAVTINNKTYVCVEDFHKEAVKLLEKSTHDYYESGAEDEISLQGNINSFKGILINPRLLVDVTNLDMSCYLLGHKVSMPISIAPTAMLKMAHKDGEIAVAKAAHKANVCMCLSSYSTSSIEDVAASCNYEGIRFFQLYFNKNRDVTANLLKRAKKSGYKAVVLTIDTQYIGIRRADEHNKFQLSPHLSLANFDGMKLSESEMDTSEEGSFWHSYVDNGIDESITWKDLQWIIDTSQLPLIVKGVLNAEDAILAKEHGVSGVWISNHGGRQIDGCVLPMHALPSIVAALKGSGVEVYVDGGVRKGSDVYKALALGADHVFFGRPTIYGLTVGGEEGVSAVLNIFNYELKRNMQLSGKSSIKELTPDAIAFTTNFF